MAFVVPMAETSHAESPREAFGAVAARALDAIRFGDQAAGEAVFQALRPLITNHRAAAAWQALALLQRHETERAYGLMAASVNESETTSFTDAVHALTLRATGRTGWEPIVSRVLSSESDPKIRLLVEQVRQPLSA